MPSDSRDSLREEFNRWAEAGRGEGMEQDHLPITLPVLEKMQLAPTDNVLDVGCGAGWLSRRLAADMGRPQLSKGVAGAVASSSRLEKPRKIRRVSST